MNSERFEEVERLYHEALELEPDQRRSFLDAACGGDVELRQEVDSLLEAQAQAAGFMGTPALDVAAHSLAHDIQSIGALVGRRFGSFHVLSRLGAGGMGEVYLADDAHLGRQVALKVLPPTYTGDPDRVRRFEQEARAASALNHPNILTIFDIRQIDDVHFIAMEHVAGETLRQRMARAPMTLKEVLDVAIQVAGALAAAHDAGIVHRDVKPENVMIRRDGYVKVVDFGLAKLMERDAGGAGGSRTATIPGMVLGTVDYMSPEQTRGEEVDARSDVFSLGVVLYETMASRTPFAGRTRAETIASILEHAPPPLIRFCPQVPSELERIVGKALSKNRDERYQTAKDLLLDLKSLDEELDFAARLGRTPSPGSVVPAARSGRRLRAPVAVVVVGLAAAAVALYLHSNRPTVAQFSARDVIVLADFVNTTGDGVFDDTLKQAVAVALEQTSFLTVFPEERVQETLRLMGRPPDEHVTRALARDIAQREGLKALLAGSISGVGRSYVIGLEAVDARTGDSLAREQVQADEKEEVIAALGRAASSLRRKLGESLGSLQLADVPLQRVTTQSLEALQAFSRGRNLHLAGDFPAAIAALRRAVEIDPNFASAYSALAPAYVSLGQSAYSRDAAAQAFALRNRVGERERLIIEERYYASTGEIERQKEVLQLFIRTFPDDIEVPIRYNNLSLAHRIAGEFELAIDAAREGQTRGRGVPALSQNLAYAFIALNRFEDARQVLRRALADGLEASFIHEGLLEVAFMTGDTRGVAEHLEWAVGRPDEHRILEQHGRAEAFHGKVRRARELAKRATGIVLGRNMTEPAAAYTAASANMLARVGRCREAREEISRALDIHREAALADAGHVFALCGDVASAEAAMRAVSKIFPRSTLVNALTIPTIRAELELRRREASRALDLLEPAGPHERAAEFVSTSLRGQAYLQLNNGSAAATAFRRILDHQGEAPLSVLYPLAHLGFARAAARVGDLPQSRKAYEEFLALWKGADADLPALVEAKQEYARLTSEGVR